MADLDATQTGTSAAPQGTQAPQFDPIAEARKKWPGLQNDSDAAILGKLSTPTGFRSAFPEYAHLSDDDITSHMNAFASTRSKQAGQDLLQSTIKSEVPNIIKSYSVGPKPEPVMAPPKTGFQQAFDVPAAALQGAVGDPIQAAKQQGDVIAKNVGDTLLTPGLGGRIKKYVSETSPVTLGNPEAMAVDLAQRAGILPKASDVPEAIKSAFVAPPEEGQTGLERGARSGGRTLTTALTGRDLIQNAAEQFRNPGAKAAKSATTLEGSLKPILKNISLKEAQQFSSALGPAGSGLDKVAAADATIPYLRQAAKVYGPARNLPELRLLTDLTGDFIEQHYTKPLFDRFGTVTANDLPGRIANDIRGRITHEMTVNDPEMASALQNEAAYWDAASQRGSLNLNDINQQRMRLNGETRTFWDKPDSVQMADMKAKAKAMANVSADNITRRYLYDRLEQLSGQDLSQFKDVQGKLLDMREALDKRYNDIYGRALIDSNKNFIDRIHLGVSENPFRPGSMHAFGRIGEAIFGPSSVRELEAANGAIRNLFGGRDSAVGTTRPPAPPAPNMFHPNAPNVQPSPRPAIGSMGADLQHGNTVPLANEGSPVFAPEYSPTPIDRAAVPPNVAPGDRAAFPPRLQLGSGAPPPATPLPPSSLQSESIYEPAGSVVQRGPGGRMTKMFTTEVSRQARPTELFEGERIAGARPEATNVRGPYPQQTPPAANVAPTETGKPRPYGAIGDAIQVRVIDPRTGRTGRVALNELQQELRNGLMVLEDPAEQLKLPLHGGQRIGPRKTR